ncbi:MAG: hypothetical protein JXR70_16990 [Spirochaetales bacterium]|nr:hypothetical protein [Spirochaetales bacterium]
MEPKKLTPQKLRGIFEEVLKANEDSRGTYLFKDFRIQISKYKASGAERTKFLYHSRRNNGLCIRCGAKVLDKNPRTGKLYRLCSEHRDVIDRKPLSKNSDDSEESKKKSLAKKSVSKAKAGKQVKK